MNLLSKTKLRNVDFEKKTMASVNINLCEEEEKTRKQIVFVSS